MTASSKGRKGAGSGSQTWQADRYARCARFVSELGLPVVELLAPRPGERILDLGCGDGALTEKLAEQGALVVGIDTSPDLIEAAQRRGVDVHLMDAQSLVFHEQFDAVFSNAALHWMLHPDAVVAGVWRALKPGGRFVGEMGGAGNIAAITTALTAALERRQCDVALPWYFPDAAQYRALLEEQGFLVATMKLAARPTSLPGDIKDWLETFAAGILDRLEPADRVAVIAELETELAPRLRDADGRWTADYVRLRFAARKPGHS